MVLGRTVNLGTFSFCLSRLSPQPTRDSRFQIPDSRFQISDCRNVLFWNLEFGIRNLEFVSRKMRARCGGGTESESTLVPEPRPEQVAPAQRSSQNPLPSAYCLPGKLKDYRPWCVYPCGRSSDGRAARHATLADRQASRPGR